MEPSCAEGNLVDEESRAYAEIGVEASPKRPAVPVAATFDFFPARAPALRASAAELTPRSDAEFTQRELPACEAFAVRGAANALLPNHCPERGDFWRRPPRTLLRTRCGGALLAVTVFATALAGAFFGSRRTLQSHRQSDVRQVSVMDDAATSALEQWEGCGPVSSSGRPVNVVALNDFSRGLQAMLATGWWFSPGFSSEDQYRPKLKDSGAWFWEGYGLERTAYWGWDANGGSGSLNVKLMGQGDLTLFVGNAKAFGGDVVVRLNGQTICSVPPRTKSLACKAAFSHGMCLSIVAERGAIIVVNGLAVAECVVEPGAFAAPAAVSADACPAGSPETPSVEGGWLRSWANERHVAPTVEPTPAPTSAPSMAPTSPTASPTTAAPTAAPTSVEQGIEAKAMAAEEAAVEAEVETDADAHEDRPRSITAAPPTRAPTLAPTAPRRRRRSQRGEKAHASSSVADVCLSALGFLLTVPVILYGAYLTAYAAWTGLVQSLGACGRLINRR
eukprot:TRINITY_DN21045_c0_g1_i1.p1 TRINITY_DN21045_c0_g1~~TRINITY_DN21045_c0_g1_i1.p1  ORF type:complete len:559 (-),score=106.43 TRINITY_DN21045_c0_g1_i1:85-1599(-)